MLEQYHTFLLDLKLFFAKYPKHLDRPTFSYQNAEMKFVTTVVNGGLVKFLPVV